MQGNGDFQAQAARWPYNLSASSPDGFFILPLDWEAEHLVLSHSLPFITM